MVARTVVVLAAVAGLAGCSYDTSATFNADGTVTIGLKFLFPASMLTPGTNTSVRGMSPSDIASANAQLQKAYPGGKVDIVTEGDQKGAAVTIPFKSEKDAFTFLTQPTKLKPSGATAGSGASINLSNTGGLFTSATHSVSGATDTYTFKTAPQPVSSPTPGQQQILTDDEVESMFTVSFALSVPHSITSAPGALFTFDHKTAIWKLHWLKSETLTATTGGSNAGLVASVSPLQDAKLLIAVGFIALAAGFLLGMFLAWRGLLPRITQLAQARANAVPPSTAAPAPPAAPPAPTEWPGPPPQTPPPTQI